LEILEVAKKARYEDGFKYCSRCRLYIKTEKYRCPFCGNPLRSSPRVKNRNKHVKRVSIA